MMAVARGASTTGHLVPAGPGPGGMQHSSPHGRSLQLHLSLVAQCLHLADKPRHEQEQKQQSRQPAAAAARCAALPSLARHGRLGAQLRFACLPCRFACLRAGGNAAMPPAPAGHQPNCSHLMQHARWRHVQPGT